MLMKDFLDYSRDIRGLSSRTTAYYYYTLKSWGNYLVSHGLGLDNFTGQDAVNYLYAIKEKGVQAACINQHRAVLLSFYDWLAAYHGIKGRAVWLSIPKAKKEKKLPITIAEEVIRNAMQSQNTETFLGSRNYMLLLVMYHTGVRSAELRELTLANTDLVEGRIKVFGKGAKERIIPLTKEAVAAIKQYLRFRELFAEPSCKTLVISKTGKPVDRSSFCRLLKDILKPFTLGEAAHAHSLRHAFATNLLKKGVDITRISGLMGHTSINTTFSYIPFSVSNSNPFDE